MGRYGEVELINGNYLGVLLYWGICVTYTSLGLKLKVTDFHMIFVADLNSLRVL